MPTAARRMTSLCALFPRCGPDWFTANTRGARSATSDSWKRLRDRQTWRTGERFCYYIRTCEEKRVIWRLDPLMLRCAAVTKPGLPVAAVTKPGLPIAAGTKPGPPACGRDEARPSRCGRDEARPSRCGRDEARPSRCRRDEARPSSCGRCFATKFWPFMR